MAPRRWRNRELPTEIVRRGDDLARVVGLSYGDVKRLLPFWHQGVDRRGGPFLIAQCGAVDFRELFAKVDLEAVCRFQALQSETFYFQKVAPSPCILCKDLGTTKSLE